jgi:hypothetical protein
MTLTVVLYLLIGIYIGYRAFWIALEELCLGSPSWIEPTEVMVAMLCAIFVIFSWPVVVACHLIWLGFEKLTIVIQEYIRAQSK